MRCLVATAVRASISPAAARSMVAVLPPDAPVVVLIERDAGTEYRLFDAAEFAAAVDALAPADGLAAVTGGRSAAAVDVDDVADVGPGMVVLLGWGQLGVLVEDPDGISPGVETARRYDAPPGSNLDFVVVESDGRGYGFEPSGIVRDLGQIAPALRPGRRRRGGLADLLTAGSAVVSTGDREQGADQPKSPAVPFLRAYPEVTAPRTVVSEQRFTLSAALRRQQRAVAFAPIMIPEPPVEISFVVQIAGFGFDFPDGIRRELSVLSADPDAAEPVAFTVLAMPTEMSVRRLLEVSVQLGGAVVGRAWAEVEIVPHAVPAADDRLTAPTGHAGGLAPPMDEAPDLTVDIRARAGSPELEWVFHCRYPDVATPSHRVANELLAGTAQAFADQLMARFPAVRNQALLETVVKGAGREVADALPPEFWPVVEAVWRRCEADGRDPTLIFNTNEPWIPWELAVLEPGRFDDTDGLPSLDHEPTLGQAWLIGRWVPPKRRLKSGDLPAAPPVAEIDVTAMVVAIGAYQPDDLLNPRLVSAEEEGKALVSDYAAIPVDLMTEEITRVLLRGPEVDGRALEPPVLHFAAHGQVDLAHPEYTGIRLTTGEELLDPLAIGGFDMLRRARPFVFLNACEVGTAGAALSGYGGMAGAFLVQGSRAMLAPLWKVDDAAASSFALEFYRLVFREGLRVGEALRQLRRDRGAADGATALAYVFYGDPHLVLRHPTASPGKKGP